MLEESGSIAALPDTPTPATTFYSNGIDRLDVTAFSYDVKIELRRPSGRWDSPIRLPGGLHKSFPSLSLAYLPNGAGGFRLSNWTPGNVASVDYESYGLDR